MVLKIKPELSSKNKYRLNKHRHYELKHFCLQYPMWKQLYSELNDPGIPLSSINDIRTSNIPGDPTFKRAAAKLYYSDKIDMVEEIAFMTDKYLYEYIIKAVTEGRSYEYLKVKMNIPCGRDMFYDRYRRFFWLLNNARE